MVAVPPKVAVFDVGNVLLRWDPRNLYVRMFDDQARMQQFLDTVCTAAWNLEQDRGRDWGEAIAALTAQHPEHAEAIAAFRTRWAEMLGEPIAANVKLLGALKARGVPVYAITNFAADTFEIAMAKFDFLHQFDGVICSGREGVIKPDPAIYHLLLDRYGLKAADCVFIDDSAQNIAGAATLGFHTIHYGIGLDAAASFRQFGFAV